MNVVSYPSMYRDPAIQVEYGEDFARDRVMIWVGCPGGQTFTKAQWRDLIISEFHRLELGQEWGWDHE